VTRSPLFYPLGRGGDAEAGGAADLQTDVMRFMAIISLCLVAIFALVQSIPISSSTPEPVSPEATAAVQPTETAQQDESTPEPDIQPAVESAIEKVVEVSLTRPTPTRLAIAPEPVALQHPVPVRKTRPVAEQVDVVPPIEDTAPAEQGFTLRFETDAALTRLVARQVVGLYAITPEQSQRMNIDGSEISFWPASVPGQFHEMDQSTVPDEVLFAFRRSNGAGIVKWGVTLPANMSSELNGYLANESGGSLVIAGSGQIDLRH
jgi:hypothetical protein